MTRFNSNGSDSARSHVAVIPSDSTNYATGPARGLYVGVAGDVAIVACQTGGAVVYKNAAAGSIIPIWHTRVNSTSTTATNLVALYD